MPDALEELWSIVRSIPAGRVASYGQVGAALRNPVSGYQVGRWMAQCPPDLPWWRVVGKNGEMRTAKRDPELAAAQSEALREEGVAFSEGQVAMDAHRWQGS